MKGALVAMLVGLLTATTMLVLPPLAELGAPIICPEGGTPVEHSTARRRGTSYSYACERNGAPSGRTNTAALFFVFFDVGMLTARGVAWLLRASERRQRAREVA